MAAKSCFSFGVIKNTLGVIKITLGVLSNKAGLLCDKAGLLRDKAGLLRDKAGFDSITANQLIFTEKLKILANVCNCVPTQ